MLEIYHGSRSPTQAYLRFQVSMRLVQDGIANPTDESWFDEAITNSNVVNSYITLLLTNSQVYFSGSIVFRQFEKAQKRVIIGRCHLSLTGSNKATFPQRTHASYLDIFMRPVLQLQFPGLDSHTTHTTSEFTGSRSEQLYDGQDLGTFKDSLRSPIHRWFKYPAGYSYKFVDATLKQFGIKSGNGYMIHFREPGQLYSAPSKRVSMAMVLRLIIMIRALGFGSSEKLKRNILQLEELLLY